MCAAQPHVVAVEDVMVLQTPKKEWTAEDHNLLTQFHEARVFNKLAGLTRQAADAVAASSGADGGGKDEKHKRFMAKFSKFTEAVRALLAEVTRNAKLLQQYISQFRRYRREVIEANEARTMVVAYNQATPATLSQRGAHTVVPPATLSISVELRQRI